LLHPLLGPVVLLAVLFAMFQLVFTVRRAVHGLDRSRPKAGSSDAVDWCAAARRGAQLPQRLVS
jgi:Fe2+ transport system protein B